MGFCIQSLRVGSFLALRAILRGNRWVSILIIVIMTLIFLNLVAIGGLLLGLIRGSELGYIEFYTATAMVEPLDSEKYIQRKDELIGFIKTLPGFVAYTERMNTGATLETNYKDKKLGEKGSEVGTSLIGLDPFNELNTTRMDTTVIEGRFLRPGDRDKIVLGGILAGRGATYEIGESLEDIYIGKKIRVTFTNGIRRNYEVVGITQSKAAILNLYAFITLDEMQNVLGINDGRVNEIAIKTADPFRSLEFGQYFENAGYTDYNKIKPWADTLGSAVEDVNKTMYFLGDIVGGIGLMVGGITIFILIFVNALSKRRFIGILKASGVCGASIILSYVFQAFFYTVIAVLAGSAFLFGFLIPYIDENPIDFAFADGILYVTPEYAWIRIIIILLVSIVSGLVPAYLITRENTLNAILQR